MIKPNEVSLIPPAGRCIHDFFPPPSHSHWYKATICHSYKYQIPVICTWCYFKLFHVRKMVKNKNTAFLFFSKCSVQFFMLKENHRPVYKYLTQIYNCLLKRGCLVENWMKYKMPFIIFLLQTRCGLSIYPLSFGDVHSPRTLHVCI